MFTPSTQDFSNNGLNILMSMIEAKFHLFQIQEKVASPDSIIAPEFVFGERPETLNAVDMVAFPGEDSFPVVNAIMPITVREKAVVGTERVGVDRAPLGNFLFDNESEDGAGNIRDWACIYPAVALEKPENSDFSGCASSAVTLAAASEIGLINFDFSGERRIALAFLGDRAADEIIDSLGAMAVDFDLSRGADCGYLEREEMDELAHHSVREATSLDKFLSHKLIIQRSNI